MFRNRLATCPEIDGNESPNLSHHSRLPTRSSTFSGHSGDKEKLRKLGRRIKKFFSDPGDNHANALCESASCSSVSEDIFAYQRSHSECFESESSTDGRRKRQTEDPLSPDNAPDSLINKSFLQKKITPSIRRTRSNKLMPGKENRPFVDMTSLMSQGGNARPPDSDLGSTFFMPTIESPEMLDLTNEEEAIVRPLHHSILMKEHCFEVITANGSRCFCCKSDGEREAWIEKIKRTLNPNLDNSRRTEHQLNLWVQEAKGIPVKKKYFCEICLDRQLYARTTSKLKDDNSIFWGEHFDFTSIPDIENITVHLYRDSDKKKKKDKDYVGLVNIPVNTLKNRLVFEKWHTLSTPSGNNKNKAGETLAIRIKARFQSFCVLPMEQYKEFGELISTDYMSLCQTMRTALTIAKKDELARSLVNIMHATGKIKEYMLEIVMCEVSKVEEESLIFRENTIGTKSVEHFLRLVGMVYLHEALGDFVHALFESIEDCEVDGSRLPANAILETNQKNLQMCCEIAMCKIINSIKFFPSELREVFSLWRAKCEAANRHRIAARLVTASLFLRLVCPAILNPSLFSLANEMPGQKASRTLTLVAKVIQNLANRTRFGDKEEYMKFMDVFVREQWDQMGEFISDVSDASKSSITSGFEGFIDLGRELAKLHAFLTEVIPGMDQKLVAELGDLPGILRGITEQINNPPSPQNGASYVRNGSKSSGQLSALDKITEDVHCTNACDNIVLSPGSTSTPLTDRRGMPMEEFPPFSSAFSNHGSQNSIPTAGSFNNSNNSHRPSLTSTENLIEPITSSTVGQSRYQPPNWIRHQQQPPLSFSNPAYQQRHQAELIQRGVSSPASLSMSALDHQTDPTVPKLTKFSPATGTDHSMSFENFDNQGSQELTGPVSSSTTVLMNQTHQPLSSAFRAGQPQPLSFTNPLQILQGSTTSLIIHRNTGNSPVASLQSNSQIETVFTTETVTYSTKTPYTAIPSSQSNPRIAVAQIKSSQEAALPSHLAAYQRTDSPDQPSSGADSLNESCHSNDTLSSRQSSTTTASTATSGTANNHKEFVDKSSERKQMTRPARHQNQSTNHQHHHHQPSAKTLQNATRATGEVQSTPVVNNKTIAMATSTSIPVASARHRTGLQKQHHVSKSNVVTTTVIEPSGVRRASVASDQSKSSTRASRSSGVGGSKNGRMKSHKYPSLQLTQIEQDALLGQTEELPTVKEDKDELVSGKAVTTSMNASNATRVRMPRKSRSGAANSVQKHSNGDKYHGSRRGSYQRNTSQIAATAADPTTFPPTTPEGPLSPEERTAQWILSTVPPLTKEAAIPTELGNHGHTSQGVSHILVKSSRINNKDYDDVISRLKGEIQDLRTCLTNAEESNREFNRREEALLEQIKTSERREIRMQDKLKQEREEKNGVLQRISKTESERKRDREELQGVIDEKDLIVTTQRKRIDSLEEANAKLLRAVNQLKELTTAHSAKVGISGKIDSRFRLDGDLQTDDIPIDALFVRPTNTSANSNNNALRNNGRPILGSNSLQQRRPSGARQSRHTSQESGNGLEYPIANGAPTAVLVNGEFRIGGLSSGGSSSSSV